MTATPRSSLFVRLREMLRLLQLVRPAWPALLRPLSMTLVASSVGLLSPLLSKALIDQAYPRHDSSLMNLIVFASFGVGFGTAILGALRSYVSSIVTSELLGRISLFFFEHLERLPIGFFDARQVGEVLSRFADVRAAFTSVTGMTSGVFVNVFYLVLVPPALFLLDWRLAAVSLAFVPVTASLSLVATSRMRESWRLTSVASARVAGLQTETLLNIRVVKAMGLETQFAQRLRDSWSNVVALQATASAKAQLLITGVALLNSLAASVFLWVGWHQILNGELTLGAFFAMSTYVGLVTGPITYFAGFASSIQQASISVERMYEYLDCQREYSAAPQKEAAGRRRPVINDVSLCAVSLSYRKDDEILHSVDLYFPSGTSTAIIGPSGAGKSSIVRVIGRLESPTSGALLIRNRSAMDIPLDDYRQALGVVTQEGGMFRGSLRYNLTLGSEYDPERLSRAIEICGLETMTNRLGLDHDVAEMGMTLSGGERQRIAIARAIVRDVSLYVFDEATSNLDLASERRLIRALLHYLKDRTVILVTHRLHWLDAVSAVCLIVDGRVVVAGLHSELLDTSGAYRDFVSNLRSSS